MKRVAILQSNYIPWKGYFDLIGAVDEFVFYDDVQYTKNDWRNRNRIKTPSGSAWLTIPAGSDIRRRVCDVQVQSHKWRATHWKTLCQNYKTAPSFQAIASWLEPLYVNTSTTALSDINRKFIEAICRYLGIETKLSWAWEHASVPGRSDRLASMCQNLGATEYLSGPAASAYLDIALFRERGISVSWFDYSNYPEYPQLWGAFTHQLSILDLLFNCGPDAARYMKHVKQ